MNTGDTLTRDNGRETLVTPTGDMVTVDTRTGQIRTTAGAKLEYMDKFDDKDFKKVGQLPGDFG